MNNLSDREIIEVLKLKAKKHEEIAKIYWDSVHELEKDIIGSIGDKPIKKQIVSTHGTFLTGTTKTFTRTTKTSFEKTLLLILNNNVPRTAKQLYNEYIKKPVRKKIVYGTFSGRLSFIIKNKESIKMHTVKEKPLSKRFYYGKAEWFDGNKLKNEYLTNLDFD